MPLVELLVGPDVGRDPSEVLGEVQLHPDVVLRDGRVGKDAVVGDVRRLDVELERDLEQRGLVSSSSSVSAASGFAVSVFAGVSSACAVNVTAAAATAPSVIISFFMCFSPLVFLSGNQFTSQDCFRRADP